MNPQTIYGTILKNSGIYDVCGFTKYTKHCKTGHSRIWESPDQGRSIRKTILDSAARPRILEGQVTIPWKQ